MSTNSTFSTFIQITDSHVPNQEKIREPQDQYGNSRENYYFNNVPQISNYSSQFRVVDPSVKDSICLINSRESVVRPNILNLTYFNCKKKGHVHQDCTVPRNRFFCYSCGRDGVRASNWPTCAIRFKSGNKDESTKSNQGNSQ